MSASWAVEHPVGAPSSLHGLPLPDPVRRMVWVMEPDRAAVALGSAQGHHDIDPARADAAGIEVVRRHSGGGAVLLCPGQMLWVDVLIPSADPHWVDDVGRSFHWLGDLWSSALHAVGIEAEVHRGPSVHTDWSDRICFAGLGPGEVTVAGRKVVGLSQRRTRAGARFQCLVLADWDPGPLLSFFALGPDERRDAHAAVADHAAGVGDGRLHPLEGAFLTALDGSA